MVKQLLKIRILHQIPLTVMTIAVQNLQNNNNNYEFRGKMGFNVSLNIQRFT